MTTISVLDLESQDRYEHGLQKIRNETIRGTAEHQVRAGLFFNPRVSAAEVFYNRALRKLGAAWGPTEKECREISEGWQRLRSQSMFCLTTKHGALDIFREVLGLENRYDECYRRASAASTATGIPFASLSDEAMLICQEGFPVGEQRFRRLDFEKPSGKTMRAANSLKSAEDRKRDAAYDPVARWLHIQQAITFAEANLPEDQRRNRPRQRVRVIRS